MTSSLETAPTTAIAARRVGGLDGAADSGQPIRGELFGLDQLREQARALAAACQRARPGPGRPLRRRLADNGRFLREAHRQIAEAYRRQESLGTDAEWLLDNFHVVAEVLREVHVDLPSTYYAELPKLSDGPEKGLPRVYVLALGLIAHTDGSLEDGSIRAYVEAFQSVTPLSIGELWAVPIMLRLGLIENLRRLAEEMLHTWKQRRAAEDLAAELCATASGPAVSGAASTPVHLNGAYSDALIVHLLARCREQGPAAGALVEELQRRLHERGANVNEVVLRENQRQAANQ